MNKKIQNAEAQETKKVEFKKMEGKTMEEKKFITEEMIAEAKEAGQKVRRGRKGTKNEGYVDIDGEKYQVVDKLPEDEKKPKQVHEPKDRDIKIESGKVGDIGVKMIYHREKDGTKQFRIYLAQKVDGKLKRIRYNTEEMKKNQKDEKFIKKVYDSILSGKTKVKIG